MPTYSTEQKALGIQPNSANLQKSIEENDGTCVPRCQTHTIPFLKFVGEAYPGVCTYLILSSSSALMGWEEGAVTVVATSTSTP